MTTLPPIAFINRAKTPLGFDLDAFGAAAQKYVDLHIAPIYGVTARIIVAAAVTPDIIPMYFMDDADEPDALAYHYTEQGFPVGRIFVRTILAAGESVTASAAHELVETMADPLCAKAIICGKAMPPDSPIQQGDIVPYEPADAVEEDVIEIDGMAFSNFVTPAWFNGLATPDSRFDLMGSLTGPFQLDAGGYAAVQRNGKDCTVFGSDAKRERWHREDRRGHRIETLWRPKWRKHLCKP